MCVLQWIPRGLQSQGSWKLLSKDVSASLTSGFHVTKQRRVLRNGCLGATKQKTGSQIMNQSWQPVLCSRQLSSLLSLWSAVSGHLQTALSSFFSRQFSKQFYLAILKHSLDSSSPLDHKPSLLFDISIQPFTPGFLLIIL